MKWAVHEACKERRKIPSKFWCEKPEGNRQLERSRHGWENNIKTGLKELESRGIDQIRMA